MKKSLFLLLAICLCVVSAESSSAQCSGGTLTPACALVCNNTSATFTLNGGSGTYFQWQTSVDGITWSDVGNFGNTTTYTLSGITTTVFVRVLTEPPGCPIMSSTTSMALVSTTPTITVTNINPTSATVYSTPNCGGIFNVSWTGAAIGNLTGVTNFPINITGLSSGCSGPLNISVTQTNPTCPGTNTGNTSVTIPCGFPASLSLVSQSSSSLKASWQATGCAGAFRIYYRLSGTNNWQYVDTAGTSKTLTFLTQGNYQVYVRAKDCPNIGQFGFSTPTQCITVGTFTCTPIPIVTASAVCSNVFTIDLTANAAGNYQVRLRKIAPVAGTAIVLNTTATILNLTLGSTTFGSVYEVTSRRICAGSTYSTWSCPVTVTIPGSCPAPTNLIISNTTTSGFDVSWVPSVCGSTMTAHQLRIKPNISANWNSYTIGPNNYTTVNWLSSQIYYNVYVRGITCGGLTAGSNVTSAMTMRLGEEDETIIETDNVSIYPNPTEGNFTIVLPTNHNNDNPILIETFNVLGATVESFVTGFDENVLSVRLGDVAAGVYYVRIKSGENVWTKPISILR